MKFTLDTKIEEEFRKIFFNREDIKILKNGKQIHLRESKKVRDEFRYSEVKYFINMLAYHFVNLIPNSRKGYAFKRKIYKYQLGYIGNNTLVRDGFKYDYGKNIYLCDNVFINHDCLFLDAERIFICDYVSLGPRVCLYTISHFYTSNNNIQGNRERKPIYIDENVWVGGNSIILPGVYVGKNSIIAAGSIVKDDVSSGTLVAGRPAKFIKNL